MVINVYLLYPCVLLLKEKSKSNQLLYIYMLIYIRDNNPFQICSSLVCLPLTLFYNVYINTLVHMNSISKHEHHNDPHFKVLLVLFY